MGTRRIRLDYETEQILKQIMRVTGLSISGALKKGLVMLRQKVYRQSQRVPYQVYKEMNLGPGGYAIVSSTRARRGVQEAIRRKHQR